METVMSRAFVNEDSAAAQADQPVERHISDHPNYVTASGLAQLHAQVSALQAQYAEQSANQRLQTAQVVTPAISTDKVQIGSWITFADEHDNHQRVQLVGEDQADAASALINWASPLGRALLGAQPGDEVTWKRPAGDQVIEVIAIEADG
jgi:transcription elongation GreA/GreB family factor